MSASRMISSPATNRALSTPRSIAWRAASARRSSALPSRTANWTSERQAMQEFDLIARYFAPLATAPEAFGLKDDAAIIRPRPGFDLVVTTDQIAAGTDFFAEDPPETVARKALRVNLSDLAAKGARPEYYLLNLALLRPAREAWLAEFARGLLEDQRQFGISLLGGDTSATKGPLK